MIYRDRKDAGRYLAEALMHYKEEHPVVLAIPRGGAELGFEVAKALDADFDLLISRKLPFPDNPESGFGAIAEDGSIYIIKEAAWYLSQTMVEKIIQQQQREIVRRIEKLRGGRELIPIKGRTVILVDDGIAMGSTMMASISCCKHLGAKKIIVAAPVTSVRVKAQLAEIVDDVVILQTPPDFHAVASVYANWYDVSDDEVLEIMKAWANYKKHHDV
jgi:predicted phosphoribosyltransferase